MSQLQGRTALVTGASRGVGRAIARTFVRQGARVVLHVHRQRQAADELAEELGAAVLGVVQADLAEIGAGRRLFAEAEWLSANRLDVLVNNAGIYEDTSIAGSEEAWLAGWERQLRVNLQAPADLCREALRAFLPRGGGVLIAIASRAGLRGDDGDHAGYAASKGGLIALMRTLARAHAGKGILAYTLTPGWIATDMAPQDAEGIARACAEIPLGRMASADELAELCAFLASGACPSATGATIDINGASYVR